jgi:DNA polymerase-3 subunit delta
VDHASLLKAAETGQVPPALLLHGPEPFLLNDAVARISQGLFPEGGDLSLVRETLDAPAVGAGAVVQAALVLPWTGSRRLVVARGLEALGARQGEPLAAYLAAPNPSTVLVLVAGELLEAGHWLARAMPAAGVVAVPRPSGRQLLAWLRARARSSVIDLPEDAAALRVELVGADLSRLAGELAKAALAGSPAGGRVGVEEVRAVVGEQRVRRIFELTDAVVRRDAGPALVLLEALLAAGEEPLAVIAVVARDLRLQWQVAEGLRQGRSEAEMARSLRRPPSVAQALVERARALSPAAAAGALGRCWSAERRLKLSSPARPEAVLLVAELCAG